jgi:rhodanese-related sulfurtransferase
MTHASASAATPITAQALALELERGQISVINVREPMEFAGGHIAGSLNVPLSRLADAALPAGALVLVCQSGNRSRRACQLLRQRQWQQRLMDLEGGIPAWQQAGLPLHRHHGAPMPLMRQVQIAAGSLVLLGLILSRTVAPAWIALTGFVGLGLTFAGLTGFCGMARLLAVMPWNRVAEPTEPA